MKKNVKKIILISTIIMMFLVIMLAAYIYFGTDTFKSPQEMFQKYTSKTFSMLDVKNNTIIQNMKNIESNSYSQEGKISLETTGKNNKTKELGNLSATINQKYNKNDEIKNIDLAVNYYDTNILNANYVEDKDKMTIILPQVINKYLLLNKSDSKDFLKKFDIDANVDFNKESKLDLNKALSLTDEEKNTLFNTYMAVINESINASSYTKQKKVNTMINDKYIEVKTYTLAINNEQLNNCIKNILVKAKEDTYLINLIKEKSTYLKIKDLKDEDIKNNIQKYIDDIDKKISNEKNPTDESLKIIIYVQGSSVCKFDISINDNIYSCTILKNTTDDLIVNVNAQVKKQNNNVASGSFNEIIGSVEADDKKEDENQNESEIEIENYSIDIERLMQENSLGISFNIDKVIDGQNNNICKCKIAVTKNNDTEFENAIKLEVINDNTTYKITFNNKIMVSDNVEVNKVDSSNLVDLNTYDKNTLNELLMAITMRINDIYTQKREEVLFENSTNTENDIKCTRVDNLSVSKEEKQIIQNAIQKRGYLMLDTNNKHYVIISVGVKSTGGYTLNLGQVKAKGKNIEINVEEKYVDEYASQEENPTIVYPFMVLELSDKPDFILVRDDELRYEFQEIDIDEIKSEIENQSEQQ